MVNTTQRNTLKATASTILQDRIVEVVRSRRNSLSENLELWCRITQVYRSMKVLETTSQDLSNSDFEHLKSVINGAS